MIIINRKPIIGHITNHIILYPTPLNLNYLWGFGSLSGLLLASQIVTGVFLAMQYSTSIELAFASVEHIMRDVPHGWFMRYMHANGASFFFAVVYLHIGRTLFYALYTKNRMYLWLSGIVIFFLMMATAFMGYVLPWGQMSFWGATVITNLFSAIPYVGESVAYWLWGGFSVGNATLNRFFSLHYLLPFVLVALVFLHLLLLHENGSYNSLNVLKIENKAFFYPYFYVKDYFGFLVVFSLLIFVVSFHPDLLGHPDNYIEANALVTPTHIVPEWYFLPFYAILRAVPNKLGGVILMALSILALVILPFCDVPYRSGFSKGRLYYMQSVCFFFGTFILLGFLGGSPIEVPYVLFAQIFSFLYFFFIFVFVNIEYFFQHAMLLRTDGVDFNRSRYV